MNDYFHKKFELDEEEDSLYPKMWITTARGNSMSAFLDYCERDVEATKRMLNYQYGYQQSKEYYFKIKKVIFNDPATIVFWADGSKTVVKCQEGDTFNKEMGLAMAISKRALGDKGRYCEEFKKWIPEIKEAKVETEVCFDDSNLRIALEKAGKTFNEAAQKIISTVHESNRVYECSKCVNFDQDTDVKKKHCAWCTEYDEIIRK